MYKTLRGRRARLPSAAPDAEAHRTSVAQFRRRRPFERVRRSRWPSRAEPHRAGLGRALLQGRHLDEREHGGEHVSEPLLDQGVLLVVREPEELRRDDGEQVVAGRREGVQEGSAPSAKWEAQPYWGSIKADSCFPQGELPPDEGRPRSTSQLGKYPFERLLNPEWATEQVPGKQRERGHLDIRTNDGAAAEVHTQRCTRRGAHAEAYNEQLFRAAAAAATTTDGKGSSDLCGEGGAAAGRHIMANMKITQPKAFRALTMAMHRRIRPAREGALVSSVVYTHAM